MKTNEGFSLQGKVALVTALVNMARPATCPVATSEKMEPREELKTR